MIVQNPFFHGRWHMFGIGWGELLLIGIVALVVFGPDKLPELATQLGKWVRELRTASTGLREEFRRELQGGKSSLDDLLRDDTAAAGGDSTTAAPAPDKPVEGFGRPVRRKSNGESA